MQIKNPACRPFTTLEEVEELGRPMLSPQNIMHIVRISDEGLRMQAREGMLPFPSICHKSRVVFPKEPFLRYMRTGDAYSV